MSRVVTTRHGVLVHLTTATPADRAELFDGFARIVDDGDGWPESPPVTAVELERTWVEAPVEVVVARVDGRFAGASLLKPNFVGRAAHIANCGYFVERGLRGRGIGRALVADSIERAPRHGFDAIMFNLVFASNPARALYEELGWREVGRVPDAVDGEDALCYWRAVGAGA